jgi:hypothetical protein
VDQKVSSYLFYQSGLKVHRDLEHSFSFLFGSRCFSQSMSFVHLSHAIGHIDHCLLKIAEVVYCYRTPAVHVIQLFEIQLSSIFLQLLLSAVRVPRSATELENG